MDILTKVLVENGWIGIFILLMIPAIRAVWGWWRDTYWPQHITIIQQRESRLDQAITTISELKEALLIQTKEHEQILQALYKLMETFQVNHRQELTRKETGA